MSLQPLQNQFAQPPLGADLHHVPQTFADAIAYIQTVVLEAFDREITGKQLCYHTREHIEGVQRRAKQLLQAVRPYLQSADDGTRMERLLDLCAVAHDLIQIFVPQTEPHATRRREAGVSETATVERLFAWMKTLNEQCSDAAHVTEHDQHIIQEAIAATICDYDPTEQAIFQPALYDQEQPISPVARILALADIGTLGMEGIEAYNREGSLLFLEENPDVRSLLEGHTLESLASDHPELCENIRQRLLKRAQFQVNFAKSRFKRCPQELQGFPVEAIPALTREFQYLSPATLQAIELTTPTAADTTLSVLFTFFQFGQVMNAIAP